MTLWPRLACLGFVLVVTPARAQHWGSVWTAASQGPYPTGITVLQPSLDAAFPTPASGARDQTFRMIIKPDLFGRQMRFRFSNAFGAKPVTIDTAFAGLQLAGAAIVPGTNRPIAFGGKTEVTLAAGADIWSDSVVLPFVHDPAARDLAGRKLAITFHIPGDSGPMTWHALAMSTSYLTAPESGAVGALEEESAYPYSTTSWFFLDAADAMVAPETRVVVCFGDGLTDGVGATLNGDDRWTDVLSRRLHGDGPHVAVVNQGLAGNRVLGNADHPLPGGPSASSRLDHDVLSLSGVTHVVWLEGAADLADNVTSPAALREGMEAAIAQIRGRFKGVKIIGATLTSARGSAVAGMGTADTDNRRHAFNALLQAPGLFDAIIDFDAATTDPQTGELRPDFVPASTGSGGGDKIDLNRPGYLAMGNAVELRLFAPIPRPKPKPRPVVKPAEDPAAPGTTG